MSVAKQNAIVFIKPNDFKITLNKTNLVIWAY